MSIFSNLEQHNLKTPQNNFILTAVRRSVSSGISFIQNILSSGFLARDLKFKINQAIYLYLVLYDNKTS